MSKMPFISDQHIKTRQILRIIGPVVLTIGLVSLIISMINFFTFDPFVDSEPKLFWLGFVAIPVLFIGSALTAYGFMGTIAKYQSREYAPVASETINYIADETKESIINIAASVKSSSQVVQAKACSHCQKLNHLDAKFCNECGTDIS